MSISQPKSKRSAAGIVYYEGIAPVEASAHLFPVSLGRRWSAALLVLTGQPEAITIAVTYDPPETWTQTPPRYVPVNSAPAGALTKAGQLTGGERYLTGATGILLFGAAGTSQYILAIGNEKVDQS